MRHPPCQRWFVLLGLVPFLWLCALDNRASAGCGDYVHVRPSRPPVLHDQPTPAAPKPCDGPACRESLPTPAPAPATVITQYPPTDAALIACGSVTAAPPAALWPRDDVRAGPAPAEPIFHPPR